MSTHPNRSGRGQHRNPRTDEIVKARIAAKLTQTEAAALIHGSLRAWQDYEGGQRKMHPGLWELFRLKVKPR